MKGLVIRNTHVQYESPITSDRKSNGHVKGHVAMNTNVKYASPTSSGLKVMAKVKVFQK